MRRYDWISLGALLILVLACPFYALRETGRMERASDAQKAQYLESASMLYVEQCAVCHGPTGAGVGVVPPLNVFELIVEDPVELYATIAYSPHGSAMAAWHTSGGGPLSDYQVESLVTFIQHADWEHVAELAAQANIPVLQAQAASVQLASLDLGNAEDPHECRACHEEPAVHAERFGLNCARCHTLQAWKPALLTSHTFLLDHGGEGRLACQTCHTETYAAHTCTTCHEHEPVEMQTVHAEQGIADVGPCASCHPTGVSGEAQALQAAPQPSASSLMHSSGH